jgi:hypothetical protein
MNTERFPEFKYELILESIRIYGHYINCNILNDK